MRRTANGRTHQGEYAQAAALFQDAISLDPANAQVRLDYAVLCIDKDDVAEAKLQAEKAVELAPDQERTHYMLGRVLYAQGDYAGAKAQLETAIAATPTFEVGYNLALTYLNLKDMNHVRLLFDEMIAGLGDSAQIHVQFGHAYWSHA